jgi:hypothetical protein
MKVPLSKKDAAARSMLTFVMAAGAPSSGVVGANY